MNKQLTFKESIADKLTKMDTFQSKNLNTNVEIRNAGLSPSTNRSSQTIDSKQMQQETITWDMPKLHILQRPCGNYKTSRFDIN